MSLFEELSGIQKLNMLVENAKGKVHSNNPKLLYKELENILTNMKKQERDLIHIR